MPLTDKYADHLHLGGPPRYTFTVSPHDTNELEAVAHALRVGTTAGDIKVTYMSGDVDTIPDVQVGETVVCGAVRIVWSTGTTAVGISAFSYN